MGENEIRPISMGVSHCAPNRTSHVVLSGSGKTNALSRKQRGKACVGSHSRILACPLLWCVVCDLELIGFYLRAYRNIPAEGIARWARGLATKWASQLDMAQITPDERRAGFSRGAPKLPWKSGLDMDTDPSNSQAGSYTRPIEWIPDDGITFAIPSELTTKRRYIGPVGKPFRYDAAVGR